MEKGTKFREPRFIEASQLRSSILSSLDDFILKLCKKYKTEKIHFEDWKTDVRRILNNRLNFLQKYKPWLFKAKPYCFWLTGFFNPQVKSILKVTHLIYSDHARLKL